MDPPNQSAERLYRRVLLLVLAVSLVLRVVLVMKGGQGFWPDESRYERSRTAIAALSFGEWSGAGRLLDRPDHPLFVVLGMAPATVERATRRSDRIPALFFSLFSVASILLVAVLMRRLGESRRAALLAALLLALSAAHFYDVRHLLPYDASMAFGLAALVAGRGSRRWSRSAACGLLAAAAFLTYEGFWLLAGFAVAAHALQAPFAGRDVARRALIAGGCFVLAIAAPIGCDAVAGGNLGRQFVAFSRAVSQGDFREGWSLPFAYLWHAEHLVAILWGVAFLWGAVQLVRNRGGEAVRLGSAGVLSIYGGLVAMSTVLHAMVVYGRLARQLVPFACIVTAAMLDRLGSRSGTPRRIAIGVLVGAILQAAVNFEPPLAQTFPAEFRRMAASVPIPPGRETRLLFASFLYGFLPSAPAGFDTVLLARPHPLQYLPYQYEGYTPAERKALRASDIRMRLLLGPPGTVKPSSPAPGASAARFPHGAASR